MVTLTATSRPSTQPPSRIDITPAAPVKAPVTIDPNFDTLSERIGEMIRRAEQHDSTANRRFIFDWMRQGAWQGIAQRLKISDPQILISEFGHLHGLAPDQVKSMPEADAKEIIAEHAKHFPDDFKAPTNEQSGEAAPVETPAPASDPVPLQNTAQGLRAECIDMCHGIYSKYGKTTKRDGITREAILARVSKRIGQTVNKFAEIPESSLQDVYDDLVAYGTELEEKASAPQFN